MRMKYNMLSSIRHVMLPKDIAKRVPKTHLMSETEWRNLGVQQSQGWVHYMIHQPGMCVCVVDVKNLLKYSCRHWMFMTSFLYRTTYLALQTSSAHRPIPVTPELPGIKLILKNLTVWRCLRDAGCTPDQMVSISFVLLLTSAFIVDCSLGRTTTVLYLFLNWEIELHNFLLLLYLFLNKLML